MVNKNPPIPHESDIEFEYDNAIELNDTRRLKSLIRKKWPLPKKCLVYAFNLQHYHLLPLLLDAGADPNVEWRMHWPGPPCTIAGDCILEENIPILKLMLEHGADPNRLYLGIPPIVLAARVGNIEALRLLVKSGAKLFDDPRIAPNALFEAVGRGHKEIVQFLIERGVNFTSRKRFGKSALDFAQEKGMTEILDLLRRYKKQRRTPDQRAKRTRRNPMTPAR